MAAPNFSSGSVWTGDNLAVMRGINSECVDLIYADPPFNSNRTYEAPIGSKAAGASFKDAWTLDDVDVCEHGELADRNPAAYSVIEAARQSHGKGMQSYLIFMAVRLVEMRRILKPSGSVYLHCDPTASHYLKLLMDSVFGRADFKNEIVWKRSSSHNSAKRWGPIHDTLLFYGGGGMEPRTATARSRIRREVLSAQGWSRQIQVQ
ncbi:MAG: DNA methyltransferase [Gemmatimonadota bacterium]|nr:DNA methyltransferase [Gemmatimonadota bacterium]